MLQAVSRLVEFVVLGLLLGSGCHFLEPEPETPSSDCPTYQLIVSLGAEPADDVLDALADDFEDCEQDGELVECFIRSETSCVDELKLFDELMEANELAATGACAPLCET